MMHTAYSFDEIKGREKKPTALTVGTFDGVHLGHQYLFKHLIEIAKQQQLSTTVITFSNHPSQILRPQQPIPLLCTTAHKLKLLEAAGIDQTVVIPFTKSFSEQSPKMFLEQIQNLLSVKMLVLGRDAHIGKDREGNREVLESLSKNMHFLLHYLSDSDFDGMRISSSRVRDCVRAGNFHEASMLLGRPYSICSTVLKGHGRGAPLGFPTANLSVEGLCHPPLGVYTVVVTHHNKQQRGVANLGYAPTLHQARSLLLEVHLFDHTEDLYGNLIDVEFRDFIRPERHFDSIAALKEQITRDIETAKKVRIIYKQRHAFLPLFVDLHLT